MPFKSESQRRWGREQVAKGEWTQAQFDEWESETPKHLPERVGKPKSISDLKKIAKSKVIK